MEITQFLSDTTKGIIPLATLTTLAADRRAFGDDILAAFTTQLELRSTQAQTVLDAATQAGRDTLLASEQRTYDASLRERDSILGLQRHVEQRTEQRAHVPTTQTTKAETRTDDASPVLTKEQRCVDFVRARGVAYAGEQGADCMSVFRVVRALATGNREGLSTLERRSLEEGTDSMGGFAVPEILGAQIIDAVRNRMVTATAGAVIVPMTSETLNLARVASPGIYEPGSPVGSGAQWKLENAEIVEGTLTLERVQLKAKTLPMLLTMSVELSEDAQGLDAAIERAMSGQMAVEVDRAALNGSGTPPEPTGILNQDDVTIDSSSHVLADFDPLIDALATLWTANFDANAIIYGPTIAAKIAKLKDQQDQPLRMPDVLANIPKLRSNQVESGQVFYGDFSNLLIGLRTGFRLEVSRTAGDAFGKLQIVIRAYLRGDVALAHPEAFVVQTTVS